MMEVERWRLYILEVRTGMATTRAKSSQVATVARIGQESVLRQVTIAAALGLAQIEAGMYYGGGLNGTNLQNKPLQHDFVSLMLKGRTNGFALKGGDATAGKFATMWDGPRPIRPHQKGKKNHDISQ